MSWSPSPQDYDDLPVADYHDHNGEQGAATRNNTNNLTSQLPSSLAHHSVGGTALTRRKMAESRKSAKNKQNPSNEVINMVPILDAQDVNLQNGAPGPSGQTNFSKVPDVFGDELTYKDMDTLKELPCPMQRKKELRQLLIEGHGQHKGSGFSTRNNVRWKRFKESIKEIQRQTTLWRSSVHEIEGRFGNGVRSYFSFLRWLFLLNFYVFLLIFVFIVVPTITFEQLKLNSNVNVSSQLTSTNNVTAGCEYNPYDPNTVSEFQQYIIWWFTGQGFMEKTLLFYGYYDNAATTIQIEGFSFYYNIPLAFVLVAFSYFLLSLVLIVRRAASGLKESLVSDEDRFYTYCNKVFAGWDFCITNQNSAKLKHSSLKYELQTDLEEELFRQQQQNRSRNEKIKLYTKRFFINCLVLIILGVSMAGIFFAAQYALQNVDTFNDQFVLDLIVTYLTSIVITFANFLAPVIFELLIKLEDYSPGFAIKFTLIRTVILRLASIMFLYVVVYIQVNCQNYPDINRDDAFDLTCDHCVGMKCWETYLGQEMYKLTILDFFIVIAVTLFIEFPRRLIVEYCHCGLAKWWGRQEFSIPENVLDIVYAQTIGWIGAFYAPLLPVIVVLKFFIFFYLKKLTLMYNCQPATRPYRASKSGAFFFIILLFGFAVAALPVGVSLAIITPSKDCGPFRGWATMFYSVTSSIQTLPQWLQDIFWFIGSAGFAIIVGVILCLVLYYFVALSTAHKNMIDMLKEQLTLEGKDKQFLLNRVNKLTEKLQAHGVWDDQSKRSRNSGDRPSSAIEPGGNDNEGFVQATSETSLPGQTDHED